MNAQSDPLGTAQDLFQLNAATAPTDLRNEGIREFDLSDTSTKGSPYLFSELQSGTIAFINSGTKKKYNFNIDLDNKVVLVKVGNELYQLNLSYIDSFGIDGTTGVQNYNVLVNKKDEHEVYEVLVDGEYTLLKEHSVKYVKSNYNNVLNTGRKYDKYVAQNDFYFFTNDRLNKLEKKEKKIKKAFKTYPVLSRSYKKLDFKLSNENEMIEFFNSVNSSLEL